MPKVLVESSSEPVQQTRASDLRAFLGALFYGRPFDSPVRVSGNAMQTHAPQEHWLTYYSTCVQYITSLHNQFIATLSIQGLLLAGCLAAVDSFVDSPGSKWLAPILGFAGCSMELVLTWIAVKLFRQHCVICWMLARIEQEKLGIPPWGAMKSVLGARGNRLFTSPGTLILTVIYGLVLSAGSAIAGVVGL